ncbi:hypothetical protein [Sphingomonas qomolangmaensis]|uniref:Uncharacterized protein n=1 Tax=Sphingomonas qomolangmaensis TaxID=2918765 RepID=A0ABY5LE24_9SPHN|nr:hypothetical protein [Sphingomonas qomolangmaensis]UUL83943.1 hypothetical protein NMP03_07055 [Sphingomonas qomolangmaensis]
MDSADRPSLADRLFAAMRSRGAAPAAKPAVPAVERQRGDDSGGFGILLAILLPAGPVLAWGAATLQASAIRQETQAQRRAAAPALAARAAGLADHAALAEGAPGIADTLNAFAATLPPDARLAAVAADERGRLSADVATPDPDTLRTALRRDPRTARLRDVGQTRGDGVILVRLREVAE